MALVINTLDHLKGSIAQFQIAPWVTGGSGGSPSYIDVGEQQALDVTIKGTTKEIDPSNSMAPTDEFLTSIKVEISLELLQADLRNLATAMGYLRASGAAGVPYPVIVTGGSGSAQLALGEPGAQQYFNILCTVRGQNMLNTGNPSNPYTALTVALWRCVQVPNSTIKLVRDGNVTYKCTYKVLRDSTAIPQTTSGLDASMGLVTTLVQTPA